MGLNYAWEQVNPDPYMACHFGVTENPRYHKCDICKNNTWCDYAPFELSHQDTEKFMQKAIKEGFDELCRDPKTGRWVVNEKRIEKKRRDNAKKLEKARQSFIEVQKAILRDQLKDCKNIWQKAKTYFKWASDFNKKLDAFDEEHGII